MNLKKGGSRVNLEKRNSRAANISLGRALRKKEINKTQPISPYRTPPSRKEEGKYNLKSCPNRSKSEKGSLLVAT